MKVLITGATGFVGSNLVRSLLKHNFSVTAVIRKKNEELWRIKDLNQLDLVYYEDILNENNRNSKLGDINSCIHLASYGVNYKDRSLEKLIDGNINLTVRVLKICEKLGIKKVILTGTAMEYSDSSVPIKENHVIAPKSLYGAAKASSVIMGRAYANFKNIETTIIRPFGIYGPYEGFHKLIPQMIRALLKKNSLELTPGEQLRDYIHVDDLCNAIIMILEKSTKISNNSVFNICSGKAVSIKQLGKEISNVMNCAHEKYLNFGALDYRKNENMYLVGDNEKILNELGWYPKIELKMGLRETINWYKEYLGVENV